MGQKCLVPKRKKEVTSGFERHRGTKWPQTAPKTPSTTRTQNFFFRTFRDINVFFTRCNFCRYFLGLPFIFDPIEMLASRQLLFDTLHTNQWWSPQCSYSKFFVCYLMVSETPKKVCDCSIFSYNQSGRFLSSSRSQRSRTKCDSACIFSKLHIGDVWIFCASDL